MNTSKKTWAALMAVVAAGATTGCATVEDGPPELIVDRSACATCSMLISELRYAAAYRIDGTDKTFDDIACMLRALAQEPDSASPRIWLRDVRDDAWIDPEDATLVRSAALRTPMAGGIVATVHADEVERLQASGDATVYASLEELIAARTAAAQTHSTGTGETER